MIEVLGTLKNIKAIAVSGGPDSMAIAHFISRANPRVEIIYINHGTLHADIAEKLVTRWCSERRLNLTVEKILEQPRVGDSLEAWWREQRYRVFNSYPGDVVTCHHLNDQAETYLFGAMNGRPKLIPYRNKNVVRPFLLVPKVKLMKWCKDKDVPFILDPSNYNIRFARNRIRNLVMPNVLEVNPGFLKVMKKKVKVQFAISQKLKLEQELPF